MSGSGTDLTRRVMLYGVGRIPEDRGELFDDGVEHVEMRSGWMGQHGSPQRLLTRDAIKKVFHVMQCPTCSLMVQERRWIDFMNLLS